MLDINPTVWASASLLELLLVAVAWVGCWAMRSNLREAKLDRETLLNHWLTHGQPVDQRRLLEADEAISTDRERAFGLLIYLVIAYAAILTPPPLRPSVSLLGNVVAVLFILGALNRALGSIRSRRNRRLLLHGSWPDSRRPTSKADAP